MESEESEYNAYMFYQLLEERTAHSHTLVEDIKITPDLGRIIAVLWEDKGIQVVFACLSVSVSIYSNVGKFHSGWCHLVGLGRVRPS